ncbi:MULTISPECIES: trimeric intracellular cation channel family protein [unclassified Nitratiruptor]|uniref:trimeric intracellular cation channel family protein n=1 Tax=unclassified Nitratiruptor TaxID=2624044 RepID=UPI001916B7AA|nr:MULTISPECIES: trimeric intracellular cation channel family protein [unclassified Nitratiruptor]BCD60182.1 hypothetical protein NitYY0810_C0947 [Nitratiruptor sp. YY08-10]BCD64329.1 hypothetical protein NitYY0814_C1174 [Nitratiruptor sp. YY08-14]
MSILEITDILGIVAFALSGYWVAAKERFDLLGAFILSFLTALGGGVLRDILVDRTPYAFSHSLPSLLVISVVLISYLFHLKKYFHFQNRTLFIVSDAIGLVSFAITGAMVATQADFNFFGVILVALITAVGGGVLRDMLLNQVPLILKSDFYGSVAIITGGLIYAVDKMQFMNTLSIVSIFVFSFLLRMIAYYRQWNLPKA